MLTIEELLEETECVRHRIAILLDERRDLLLDINRNELITDSLDYRMRELNEFLDVTLGIKPQNK